jgi:hypothetical protein
MTVAASDPNNAATRTHTDTASDGDAHGGGSLRLQDTLARSEVDRPRDTSTPETTSKFVFATEYVSADSESGHRGSMSLYRFQPVIGIRVQGKG